MIHKQAEEWVQDAQHKIMRASRFHLHISDEPQILDNSWASLLQSGARLGRERPVPSTSAKALDTVRVYDALKSVQERQLHSVVRSRHINPTVLLTVQRTTKKGRRSQPPWLFALKNPAFASPSLQRARSASYLPTSGICSRPRRSSGVNWSITRWSVSPQVIVIGAP